MGYHVLKISLSPTPRTVSKTQVCPSLSLPQSCAKNGLSLINDTLMIPRPTPSQTGLCIYSCSRMSSFLQIIISNVQVVPFPKHQLRFIALIIYLNKAWGLLHLPVLSFILECKTKLLCQKLTYHIAQNNFPRLLRCCLLCWRGMLESWVGIPKLWLVNLLDQGTWSSVSSSCLICTVRGKSFLTSFQMVTKYLEHPSPSCIKQTLQLS